ncbi:MAG: hypothetical protein Fur0022_31340 [Anaerolineales bacterium]
MKFIARFFAFLAALLLIILLPLSLLSFNVGRVIFNRALLTTVLTDAVTESELIPAALAWFSEEVSAGLPLTEAVQDDLSAVFLSLTQEGWTAIRAEVLSDDILAGWTSSIVDSFYAWLDTEAPAPTFSLDMQSFKARINSDFGLRAIEIAYNALPICDNAQVEAFRTQLETALPGLNIYYPPCQFPEEYKTDQLTDYLNSLTEVVNVIPDSFTLPVEPQAPESWQTLKSALRIFRTAFWLALIIPLFLWGLIALLVIRTPRGLARWGGIPLALAGILTILLSWAPGALITGFLLSGPLQGTTPVLRDEILQIVSRLLQEIFSPMMLQGLVVLLLGGIMIVMIGGMMGKQPPKKTREEANARNVV